MLSEQQKALAWDGLKAAYTFMASGTKGKDIKGFAESGLLLLETIETDIYNNAEKKRKEELKRIAKGLEELQACGEISIFPR